MKEKASPPRSHLMLAAGVLSTYPGMEMVENFLKEQASVTVADDPLANVRRKTGKRKVAKARATKTSVKPGRSGKRGVAKTAKLPARSTGRNGKVSKTPASKQRKASVVKTKKRGK
jgi:hypothetical protein